MFSVMSPTYEDPCVSEQCCTICMTGGEEELLDSPCGCKGSPKGAYGNFSQGAYGTLNMGVATPTGAKMVNTKMNPKAVYDEIKEPRWKSKPEFDIELMKTRGQTETNSDVNKGNTLSDTFSFDSNDLAEKHNYKEKELSDSFTGGKDYYALRVSDFRDLVKSRTYVDKTLLIKEFFEHDYLQISAPPNYGKSANMTMIKTFCEANVDENGTRLPRELTSNYLIFKNNQLDVFKEKDFFDKHFGVYPVIHMDFNDLNTQNFKTFYSSFKKLIRHTFRTHKYLLRSEKLYEDMQDDFKLFYKKRLMQWREDWELSNSMKVLGKLLYTHFDNKCIVMIDGLDSPVDRSLTQSQAETGQIHEFLLQFISNTIQTNPFTQKGILNTCLRFAIDANNIKLITFLRHPVIADYYGFTNKDVEGLLAKVWLVPRYDQLKDWYGGHRNRNSDEMIFDPLAVSSYVATERLTSFASRVEAKKNVLPFAKIKKDIEFLMKDFERDNKGMRIKYKHLGMTPADVDKLKDVISKPNVSIDDGNKDLLLQYLTEKGYFTVYKEEPPFSDIRLPNEEMKAEIDSTLLDLLVVKMDKDENKGEEPEPPSVDRDEDAVNDSLKDILKD